MQEIRGKKESVDTIDGLVENCSNPVVLSRVKKHYRKCPMKYQKTPTVLEIEPDAHGDAPLLVRDKRLIIHVVGWQGNASKKKE